MSYNFPNAPSEGQLFTPAGGYQYLFTGGVWRITESLGLPITRIERTTFYSSGTYTKPAGLKFLEVWLVGGGGGCPDSPSSAAGQSAAVGGGGGAGGVIQFYEGSSVAASVPYTIGAAGSLTTPGGASGFASMAAGGGAAAQAAPAGTSLLAAPGGTGGSASGGLINMQGGTGHYGLRCAHASLTTWQGGAGGGSLLAQSGVTRVSGGVSTGIAGTGRGGGGSGGGTGAGAAQVGAVGTAGQIIFTEYF